MFGVTCFVFRDLFTMTNLVVFSELENSIQIDAVFLDFAKAFNRVDHFILVGKLL